MTDQELIARLRLPWPKDGSRDKVTLPLWVLILTAEAADRIESLTEQLAAAQHDAKEAEDYAEEVEKELNTCRMAQAVMDNTVADLEAKLAKAVDAFVDLARATLAEIKGESHD